MNLLLTDGEHVFDAPHDVRLDITDLWTADDNTLGWVASCVAFMIERSTPARLEILIIVPDGAQPTADQIIELIRTYLDHTAELLHQYAVIE